MGCRCTYSKPWRVEALSQRCRAARFPSPGTPGWRWKFECVSCSDPTHPHSACSRATCSHRVCPIRPLVGLPLVCCGVSVHRPPPCAALSCKGPGQNLPSGYGERVRCEGGYEGSRWDRSGFGRILQGLRLRWTKSDKAVCAVNGLLNHT